MPSDPARTRVDSIVPMGPPTVEVAAGAGLFAIVEPDRIAIATLPDLRPQCEIGIDPDASGCDAIFVGPDRLLVTSRFTAHTTAYLIDPNGPRKLAELRIESPIHLLAVSDGRALARGPQGTAVISALDDQLEIARLPIRSEPSCAAGLGGGRFVVSVAGAFEEWDAATRAPVRRFKLSRPQQIRTLGYSGQQLWWIASSDATRIEVLPIGNRGQVRVHVLPEPIATAVGHVEAGIVLAIGADSRRVYVVDVRDGGSSVELACGAAADVAIAVDRHVAALVVAQGRPVELVALDAPVRPLPVAVPADERSVLGESGERDGEPLDEAPATPAPPSASGSAPISAGTPPPAESGPSSSASATTQAPTPTDPTVARRLLEWRDRMRSAARPAWRRGSEPTARAPTWRDDLVTWGRSFATGLHRDPPPRSSGSPLALLLRLELPEELLPGIALAYAMHLAGTHGVAPAELASVLGHRWDEALGNGVLGASGVLRWRASRAVLAPAVLAFLDERAPVTGFILGVPGERVPSAPAAVVAPQQPLDIVAGRCTARIGAVLLPHARASITAIRLEARLRVAVPIVEGDTWQGQREMGAALVRVTSPDEALAFELPVIATFARE